jgi:hypothetical protein
MASKYIIKLKRKVVSLVNLLIEAGQRILNLESQRKVSTALGTKKASLRTQLKPMSNNIPIGLPMSKGVK